MEQSIFPIFLHQAGQATPALLMTQGGEAVPILFSSPHYEACNNNERTDGPHASLDLMIQTMHRATNPGAANTRKWFHEANRMLMP